MVRNAEKELSIVVPTRNSASSIRRCLSSALACEPDRIVVVDTGSVDSTVEVVHDYMKLGVELVRLPWPGSFASMRNFAIENVLAGWVFFLDSDEWIDQHSASRIRSKLRSCAITTSTDRYSLRRSGTPTDL